MSRVHDMLPFRKILKDGQTIATRDGEFFVTIEVTGRDYSGLSDDLQEALYKSRKLFFEDTPPDLKVYIHTIRHQLSKDMIHDHHGHKLIDLIAKTWAQNFKRCYRNRHVVVLCTKSMSKTDALLNFGTTEASGRSDQAKYRQLKDAVQRVMLRLKPFYPRILTRKQGGGSLLSFWAWLVNGETVNFHTEADDINDLIAGNELHWPEDNLSVQEYVNGGRVRRYSAWLAIKELPKKANAGVLDEVLSLPIPLSIHQSFAPYAKQDAKDDMDDREALIGSFEKDAGILHDSIEEAKTRLTADDFDYGEHSFSVQIFGDSPEELEENVSLVSTAITNREVLVYRETVNCEALFWSIFPTMEKLNARRRNITSENSADFCSLASIGEGFDACSWGPEPVTLFKTVTDSDYSFTFHRSPRPEALGNTLIIGGSESGKTTLITFLAWMATKYQGFKFLAFDRMNGMEVSFRMFDGDYTDFNGRCQINPFQMPDTPANRAFLVSWLQSATSLTDDASLAQISEVVDQNYKLDKEHRRLGELELSFGLKGSSSFREAIQKWLPNGSYGQFINGDYDSLDFTAQAVGYDTTLLHEMPDVFGGLVDYIFYRFRSSVLEHSSPHMVFIDEIKGALMHPTFGPRILSEWQQIRKTDGVIIGAIQEASGLINSDFGEDMIKSTATLLLFPDPSASRKDYVEGMGLTEAEFEWIKQPSLRQVMLKRRGGESTILNIDLSSLGPLLDCFNSSSRAVQIARREQAAGGNWRKRYFNEMAKRSGR